MKKIVIGIMILIVVMFIIIGGIIYFSNDTEISKTIVIFESVWGAGIGDFVEEDSKNEYTVKKGDVITISKEWDEEITLEITDIKEDYIMVKTNQALSDTGGVHEGKNDFKIEKNKPISLNTLTMDAGASYDIEIK